MQRFDYMNQKQAAKIHNIQQPKEPNIIAQQSKSQEQAARDKMNEEKKVAQDMVDSVLYQDVKETRKTIPVVTPLSVQENAAPVTPVVQKKPIIVEDNPTQTPVVHDKLVSSPKKTRYDDAIVNEFKEKFDQTDVSGAVPVSPKDVDIKSIVEPVASPEIIPTVSSAVNISKSDRNVVKSNKSPSKKDVKKEAIDSVLSLSKEAKKAYEKGTKVPMASLKKVPTHLVQPIQKLFGASNQSDAICALCYYFLGKNPDIYVDDKIKELANNYNDDDITIEEIKDDLHKDLSDIKASNRLLMNKLITIELGIAYGLFDEMGFRKIVQETPGNVEFMEHGMLDLISNLEKTSSLYQNRQAKAGKL